MQFESTIGDKVIEVNLPEGESAAEVNGKKLPFELIRQDNGRVLFRTGTKLYKIDNVVVDGINVSFSLNGKFYKTTVKDEQELLLEKLGFDTSVAASFGQLDAPMPGKILELMVKEGDDVEEGDSVIILEAMKMENELKAPASGTVIAVNVAQNDNVEKNQPLLEIEPRG